MLEGTFYEIHDLEPAICLGPSRYRKQVVYEGELLKRQPGRPVQQLSFDRAKIDHWDRSIKEFLATGIKVPMPKGHTEDPEAKRADVVGSSVGPDAKGRHSLYVELEFTKPEYEMLAKSDVSIYSPPRFTHPGTKKDMEWPVRHVAFTDYPVAPDLEPFQAVAMSFDQPRDEKGRFGSGGGGSSAKSGHPTDVGGKTASSGPKQLTGSPSDELLDDVNPYRPTSAHLKTMGLKAGPLGRYGIDGGIPILDSSREHAVSALTKGGYAHAGHMAKAGDGEQMDIFDKGDQRITVHTTDDGRSPLVSMGPKPKSTKLSSDLDLEDPEAVALAGFPPPAAPAAPVAPTAPAAPAAPAQGPAKVPTLRDIATKLGVPATVPEVQLLVQVDAKITALMAPKPAAPAMPVPMAPAAPMPGAVPMPARPVAASLANMARENRERKLVDLVKEGRVTTAVMEDLKKQFASPDAISLAFGDEAKDDGFDSIVASLAKNEPRQAKEKTGGQGLGAYKDSPVLKEAEKRAAEAK